MYLQGSLLTNLPRDDSVLQLRALFCTSMELHCIAVQWRLRVAGGFAVKLPPSAAFPG